MSGLSVSRGVKILLIAWLGAILLNGCGKDEEHVRRAEPPTSGQPAGQPPAQQPPTQVYVPIYVPSQQPWPQQPQQQWGVPQWPQQQPGGGYGTPPQYGTQPGSGYGTAPQYAPPGAGQANPYQYNAQPQPWGSTYQPRGYGADQSYGQYQYRPLEEKPTGKKSEEWSGTTPPSYYASPYGYGAPPYGGAWPGTGFPYMGGFPGAGWPLGW